MRLCCWRAGLWLAVGAVGLGVAPASGARERLLRAWVETERIQGEDVLRRKEVVFDYATGVAQERTLDLDGQVLASRAMVDGQPRPSAEEISEAFALIQADPKLGRLVSRVQAEPMGGFVLEEPAGQACGPRTRCLQVSLVAKNGLGTLRWVVVDLTRQAIVYANYGSLERDRLLRGFWGVKQ
jgi:hypothetical protein